VSYPYGGLPGSPADREPGDPSSYAPYGANPYGGNPYGGNPYGAPAAGAGVDPVSITGFVLSLLCCTGFVGVILGIVGLGRTKNGIRKGRWAAVSAIAIGAVTTVLFVGVVAVFTWFGTSTVTLESADVGQCVNVDELSGNDATLYKKDCDEPHEAEVAVTADFTSDQADAFRPGFPDAVCTLDLFSQEYAAVGTGDYDIGLVFEATDPDPSDAFVCYLELSNGDDLDEPIVD
jgi:hypothetical protein